MFIFPFHVSFCIRSRWVRKEFYISTYSALSFPSKLSGVWIFECSIGLCVFFLSLVGLSAFVFIPFLSRLLSRILHPSIPVMKRIPIFSFTSALLVLFFFPRHFPRFLFFSFFFLVMQLILSIFLSSGFLCARCGLIYFIYVSFDS